MSVNNFGRKCTVRPGLGTTTPWLPIILPRFIIDWEHTIVMTMCVQIAKQGGRSYNSNGYLWHYYEHIVGCTSEVKHIPLMVQPSTIPQADEDLYVDLGLPSGLSGLPVTSRRNAEKQAFAKVTYQRTM